MADGFSKIETNDPPKLRTFIEGVSSSVVSIMDSLVDILYNNDPNEIPPADYEAAINMPYDTDIPDDENADIPDNQADALRANAYKLTRISAVKQAKEMVSLIDTIAATAIVNMVEGEEMRTKTPMGMQMIMGK
jgi:hypothetical protein